MRTALARDATHITERRQLKTAELPFEFMLNALRLEKGVASSLYTERCGLPIASMNKALLLATQKGLLVDDPLRLQATELGWRFLNELQALFL
jgi:oxygen-independent coproporphyrinogen-3 oxidase